MKKIIKVGIKGKPLAKVYDFMKYYKIKDNMIEEGEIIKDTFENIKCVTIKNTQHGFTMRLGLPVDEDGNVTYIPEGWELVRVTRTKIKNSKRKSL
jgi:hypothetical protein